MGSNCKSGKRNADVSLLDEDLEQDGRSCKRMKPYDGKGTPTCHAIITEEWKTSSGPPSPVPFLSLDGRTVKPAEIFRTDLISAMKLPDSQLLNPENYITIIDSWRQEWERGVQVPVRPEGLSQPLFRPVETNYKKSITFKLPGKLLNSDEKRKGRYPCIYDLNRMDVEWLTNLNRSRKTKGRVELEEGAFEKAIAYLEDKCYENMGYAIVTQKGLSIEYDESVCCDVCQSPDSEEGNEMVFCDSCDICVHQACYGIQNIPAGSWLCKPCRWGIASPPCHLCPNSGGAIKKAKIGKKWVHVSCALWIPEVGFGSVERMEPIIKIENIPSSRWNLVCYICREKMGACIQCTVKSCVTAFHVTCGFKNGLDMRTVLDDSAVDGVRHICYCAKHCHKNKSPQCSPEKNKQNKEDAENLRQKRLKQMESEFYKYVNVAEATKDLGMPKELVAHVHSYWTLKRKSRDDVPLLPPTIKQQEKLSGKQGAADISRNLQHQIEQLLKMRCDMERLRNLCYMVSKREKMRRELFRARERVFWKAHELMTDDSLDVDESEVNWIRAACRENFSGDGSAPAGGPDGGDPKGRISMGGSSTSSIQFSNGSNLAQTNPEQGSGGGSGGGNGGPSDETGEDLRGEQQPSDSENSSRVRTRKSSTVIAARMRQNSENQERSTQETGTEVQKNPAEYLNNIRERRRSVRGRRLDVECGSSDDSSDTPRRSLRILKVESLDESSDEVPRSEPSDKVPSPRTKWREHVGNSEVPQTSRTRRRASSTTDTEAKRNQELESEYCIGLRRPRTRGQTSESSSVESMSGVTREDSSQLSPNRSLRSRRQLSYQAQPCELMTASDTSTEKSKQSNIDDVLTDRCFPAREKRSTRIRQISTSTSEDDELLLNQVDEKMRKTCDVSSAEFRSTVDGDTTESDQVLKENLPMGPETRKTRNRTMSDGRLSEDDRKTVLRSKRRRSEDVDVRRRRSEGNRNSRRRSLNGCVFNGSIDRKTQSRVTGFLLVGSPQREQGYKSPETEFHNGYKCTDNRTTDCENAISDEENAVDRVQRLSSLRSFSNGREMTLPESPCPNCRLQHERHRGYSPDLKYRNTERSPLAKELRLRNMQSPKARGRLSSSLRLPPGRGCGSLLAQVCHATSVV